MFPCLQQVAGCAWGDYSNMKASLKGSFWQIVYASPGLTHEEVTRTGYRCGNIVAISCRVYITALVFSL